MTLVLLHIDAAALTSRPVRERLILRLTLVQFRRLVLRLRLVLAAEFALILARGDRLALVLALVRCLVALLLLLALADVDRLILVLGQILASLSLGLVLSQFDALVLRLVLRGLRLFLMLALARFDRLILHLRLAVPVRLGLCLSLALIDGLNELKLGLGLLVPITLLLHLILVDIQVLGLRLGSSCCSPIALVLNERHREQLNLRLVLSGR